MSNLSDVDWKLRYSPCDDYVDPSKVAGFIPLNAKINELLDSVSPVDPSTGTRPTLLDELNSDQITAAERSSIVSTLVKIPVCDRFNVSDKDLAAMLPSRYNCSQVDIQGVRDWYQSQIFNDPSFKDAVVDESLKK